MYLGRCKERSFLPHLPLSFWYRKHKKIDKMTTTSQIITKDPDYPVPVSHRLILMTFLISSLVSNALAEEDKQTTRLCVSEQIAQLTYDRTTFRFEGAGSSEAKDREWIFKCHDGKNACTALSANNNLLLYCTRNSSDGYFCQTDEVYGFDFSMKFDRFVAHTVTGNLDRNLLIDDTVWGKCSLH
jgi:hypothetical protein